MCSLTAEYEPYILCRRDVAPLDLRFVGYGGDKTSHIYELSRGGHVLVVVPQAFVVHEHHAAGLGCRVEGGGCRV